MRVSGLLPPPPVLGLQIQKLISEIYVGAGDPNLGLHVCVAGTYSTEPVTYPCPIHFHHR